MRRDLLIIAGVLMVAVLVVALVVLSGAIAHADILSVTTDNDLYHSNNVMKITVTVTSSGKINNAVVNITGITDRYGDDKLVHVMPVNLSPGTNTLTYNHQLPSCSHCSGLDPGTYSFNITLERDGMIMDQANHSIRIEQ
ncbi:MAG: hypothetical protein HGA40_06250 [Methanoregulaceae archaeon]|nr:hypothetical protein [Methanoregulaceae archaeon]